MNLLITYHRANARTLLQDCVAFRIAGQHAQAALLFEAAKSHGRILRAIEAGDAGQIGEALFL